MRANRGGWRASRTAHTRSTPHTGHCRSTTGCRLCGARAKGRLVARRAARLCGRGGGRGTGSGGEIKRAADQRGRRAIGIRHYYYASITERAWLRRVGHASCAGAAPARPSPRNPITPPHPHGPTAPTHLSSVPAFLRSEFAPFRSTLNILCTYT